MFPQQHREGPCHLSIFIKAKNPVLCNFGFHPITDRLYIFYYCSYNEGGFFSLYKYFSNPLDTFCLITLRNLSQPFSFSSFSSLSSSFDQILPVTPCLCLEAFCLGGSRICSSLTFVASYRVSSLSHSYQFSFIQLLNISSSFYLSSLLCDFVLKSLPAREVFMGVGMQSAAYLTK